MYRKPSQSERKKAMAKIEKIETPIIEKIEKIEKIKTPVIGNIVKSLSSEKSTQEAFYTNKVKKLIGGLDSIKADLERAQIKLEELPKVQSPVIKFPKGLTVDQINIERDAKELGISINFRDVLADVSMFAHTSHFDRLEPLRKYFTPVRDLDTTQNVIDSITELTQRVIQLREEFDNNPSEIGLEICKQNVLIRGYCQQLRDFEHVDYLKTIDGTPEKLISDILSATVPSRELSPRMKEIHSQLFEIMFALYRYDVPMPSSEIIKTALIGLLNTSISMESSWAKRNIADAKKQFLRDIEDCAHKIKGKTNMVLYNNIVKLQNFLKSIQTAIDKINSIVNLKSFGFVSFVISNEEYPIEYKNKKMLTEFGQKIRDMLRWCYDKHFEDIIREKFDYELPIFNEFQIRRQNLIVQIADCEVKICKLRVEEHDLLIKTAESELAMVQTGKYHWAHDDTNMMGIQNDIDYHECRIPIIQEDMKHPTFLDMFLAL